MPHLEDNNFISQARRGRISRHIYRSLIRGDTPEVALDNGRRYASAPQNWHLSYAIQLQAALGRTGCTIAQSAAQSQTTEIPTNLSFDLTEEISSTMTFGVELEILVPQDISNIDLSEKLLNIGIDCQYENYNHNTRTHWKIVSDGSVDSHVSTHRGGVELVSPILKGTEGLEKVRKVCDKLKELNVLVNKTCGLHIHHGCQSVFGRSAHKVAKAAAYVYYKFQDKINDMMPPSRKDCYHAKKIDSYDVESIKRTFENSTKVKIGNRYRVVNLESYWRHGTVEFRHHSGTVDSTKVINWIKLTQKIMVKAFLLSGSELFSYQFGQMEEELQLSSEMKRYVQDRIRRFSQAA